MFNDLIALTGRALKKWIRNPAAVLPGFFTALFYLALFGNSFNPTSLIPSNMGGFQLTPAMLQSIKTSILSQTFGGAATYISYLTAGIICLILVFNMAFGGIRPGARSDSSAFLAHCSHPRFLERQSTSLESCKTW